MKWLLLVIVILLGGIAAEQSQAEPDASPMPIKSGDRVSIGDAKYAVRIISADNQITRTEDGCVACWKNRTIAVFNPVHGVQEKDIACPWNLYELSRGRRWAVVTVPDKPGYYRYAIADLATKKIVARLPTESEYTQWDFTQKYAIPLQGLGRFAVVKLDTGEVVEPKLPDRPDLITDPSGSWSWSTIAGEDENHVTILLREFWSHGQLGTIDLNHPDAGQFKTSDLIGFNKPIGADRLLVSTWSEQGDPGKVAVVTRKTLKIQEQFAADSNRSLVLQGTPGPDGKRSWFIDRFKGTTIYDSANGKVLGHAPGLYWNAQTLGVVFADGGKLAIIAVPYEHALFILDAADYHTVAEFDVGKPAGAIMLPPPQKGGIGQLVVFQSNLPYE